MEDAYPEDLVDQQFDDQVHFSGRSSIVSAKEADNFLLIDVSHLAFRSAYAYPNKTTTGLFTGHVFGALTLVLSTLRNDLPAGKWGLVFCLDGLGAKKERQKIVSNYKENRKKPDFMPIPDVQQALCLLPGIKLQHLLREGDDAIAFMAQKVSQKGKKAVILTSDKDVWPLSSLPGVSVFPPALGRFVKEEDVIKHFYDPDPRKIYLTKAILGDTSDNIKGANRLSRKNCIVKYLTSDPDEFFISVDEDPEKVLSPLNRQKLLDAEQQIRDNLSIILPKTDLFEPELLSGDKEAFLDLLKKYECNTLIEKVDHFFGQEFWVAS